MPHSPSSTKKRLIKAVPLAKPDRRELYHVIIHCRDEAQQRELYDRLRREGLPCRLTIL
jgi:hypothetical protein